MPTNNQTVLDTLMSEFTFACEPQAVTIEPADLVHVVGSQEPFRDQPDACAQTLLRWLPSQPAAPEGECPSERPA